MEVISDLLALPYEKYFPYPDGFSNYLTDQENGHVANGLTRHSTSTKF